MQRRRRPRHPDRRAPWTDPRSTTSPAAPRPSRAGARLRPQVSRSWRRSAPWCRAPSMRPRPRRSTRRSTGRKGRRNPQARRLRRLQARRHRHHRDVSLNVPRTSHVDPTVARDRAVRALAMTPARAASASASPSATAPPAATTVAAGSAPAPTPHSAKMKPASLAIRPVRPASAASTAPARATPSTTSVRWRARQTGVRVADRPSTASEARAPTSFPPVTWISRAPPTTTARWAASARRAASIPATRAVRIAAPLRVCRSSNPGSAPRHSPRDAVPRDLESNRGPENALTCRPVFPRSSSACRRSFWGGNVVHAWGSRPALVMG
jgi:hypothetical protein